MEMLVGVVRTGAAPRIAIVIGCLFASQAWADRHVLTDKRAGLEFVARGSNSNCQNPAKIVIYGRDDNSFANDLRQIRRNFPLVIDDLLTACPKLSHVRVEGSLDEEPVFWADARVADKWVIHREQVDDDDDDEEDFAAALQSQLAGLPPEMRAAVEKQLSASAGVAEAMRSQAEGAALAQAQAQGNPDMEAAKRKAAPEIKRAKAFEDDWNRANQERGKRAAEERKKVLAAAPVAEPGELKVTHAPTAAERLLITKSMMGKTEEVKKLLADGTNPNVFVVGGVQILAANRSTPLSAAVDNGNPEIVKLLIEKGADPNIDLDTGASDGDNTVLAFVGSMRIGGGPKAEERAQMLLDHGARVTPRAMVRAAANGRIQLLRLYVSNGGDAKALSEEGQSQLTLFLRSRSISGGDRLDGLMLLLDAGADPNHVTPNGNTALSWVMMLPVQSKIVECAQVLLERGANPAHANSAGETPLTILASRALKNEVGGILEALIPRLSEAGADLDARGKRGETTIYRLAQIEGDRYSSAIAVLVERGADVNIGSDEGRTPLIAAATKKNDKLVDLLLKNGADANAVSVSGETAISATISPSGFARYGLGDTPRKQTGRGREALRLLMEHKGAVPPTESKQPLLSLLIDVGEPIDVIDWMIARGADLNETSNKGGAPVVVAAAVGRIDVVVALAEAGADVTVSDSAGRTAPMLIVSMANDTKRGASARNAWPLAEGEAALRILFEKGADPNAIAENGANAVYALVSNRAAQKSQGMLRLLLDAGGDPSLRVGDWMNTAVYQAAVECRGDLLKMLIDAGADLSLTNKWGYTAYEEAERRKRGQCPDIRRIAQGTGA